MFRGCLGYEADPRFVDVDPVAGSELGDCLRKRALELRGVGASLGLAGDEADAVANADAHLVATPGDPARAGARSLEVDQHPAGTPALLGRPSRVGCHRGPLLGRVMRAVDPHHIGAVPDELAHERIVVGRFAWQRDHDSHLPARGRRPEGGLRVSAKEAVAAVEGGGPWVSDRGRARLLPGHRGERSDHRIQVRERSSLAPAQRRQPERHQRFLKGSQVPTPQRDVAREVYRARQERASPERRPPLRQELVTLGYHLSPELDERPKQDVGRLWSLLPECCRHSRSYRRSTTSGRRRGMRGVSSGISTEERAFVYMSDTGRPPVRRIGAHTRPPARIDSDAS